MKTNPGLTKHEAMIAYLAMSDAYYARSTFSVERFCRVHNLSLNRITRHVLNYLVTMCKLRA